jgi:hypothetical protein
MRHAVRQGAANVHQGASLAQQALKTRDFSTL